VLNKIRAVAEGDVPEHDLRLRQRRASAKMNILDNAATICMISTSSAFEQA
jgi:hypothetical protein